jgi:hypothetical protein
MATALISAAWQTFALPSISVKDACGLLATSQILMGFSMRTSFTKNTPMDNPKMLMKSGTLDVKDVS